MDVLDRMNATEFLGREFLTWLWCRSELQGGVFQVEGAGDVPLWIEGKVTLRSDEEGAGETVTCTGESSGFREARVALRAGKKVSQARLRLTLGDEEWTLTLDARTWDVRGMKGPKTLHDAREDPEGFFLERFGLIERVAGVLDRLLIAFVRLRASEAWHREELPAMARWIAAGAPEPAGPG
jgi:recombination associated protein RdgC